MLSATNNVHIYSATRFVYLIFLEQLSFFAFFRRRQLKRSAAPYGGHDTYIADIYRRLHGAAMFNGRPFRSAATFIPASAPALYTNDVIRSRGLRRCAAAIAELSGGGVYDTANKPEKLSSLVGGDSENRVNRFARNIRQRCRHICKLQRSLTDQTRSAHCSARLFTCNCSHWPICSSTNRQGINFCQHIQTRLATVNRSRVIIRATKHFGQVRRRNRYFEKFSSHLLYRAEFGCFSCCARACVGPKIFGYAGAPPSSDGDVDDPVEMRSSPCSTLSNVVVLGQTVRA